MYLNQANLGRPHATSNALLWPPVWTPRLMKVSLTTSSNFYWLRRARLDPSRLLKDYYFRYLRDDQDFADACLLDVDTEMELVVKDASIKHDPTYWRQVSSRRCSYCISIQQPETRLNGPSKSGIPCISITMSGTRPTFYLVPVMEELSRAVITGHYSLIETTTILKCVTVGCRIVLAGIQKACFATLVVKNLAESHWHSGRL